MTEYYFDTSVWIAYFNEKEFYHKEAIKWFERIKENDNKLVVSIIVEDEIKNKRYFDMFDKTCYELECIDKIRKAELSEENIITGKELNKILKFGINDVLQIILCKEHNLEGVSADIHHWPKIARELGISIHYITYSHF